MLDGVEGEAASIFSGAVTQPVGHNAVRKLVQNNRKNYDDQNDNNIAEVEIHFSLTLPLL